MLLLLLPSSSPQLLLLLLLWCVCAKVFNMSSRSLNSSHNFSAFWKRDAVSRQKQFIRFVLFAAFSANNALHVFILVSDSHTYFIIKTDYILISTERQRQQCDRVVSTARSTWKAHKHTRIRSMKTKNSHTTRLFVHSIVPLNSCIYVVDSFAGFVHRFQSVGRSHCHIKIIHSSALNAIIVPLSLKANNNRVHTTNRRKGMKEETAKKRVFMLCDRFINVCTRLVRAAAAATATVENKLRWTNWHDHIETAFSLDFHALFFWFVLSQLFLSKLHSFLSPSRCVMSTISLFLYELLFVWHLRQLSPSKKIDSQEKSHFSYFMPK